MPRFRNDEDEFDEARRMPKPPVKRPIEPQEEQEESIEEETQDTGERVQLVTFDQLIDAKLNHIIDLLEKR